MEASAAWKLHKETLPPGYMDEEKWWGAKKVNVLHARRDSTYLDFLFNKDSGLFGFRRENRWRCYPRKWIETFVVIQDRFTLKITPFKLNEAQRRLLATILRQMRRGLPVRIAILKARQEGISTFVAAMLAWAAITMPHTRGMLMGHKKTSSAIIKGRMETMIENLRRKGGGRHWLVGIDISNRTEITLSPPINSTILADSAEAPDYRGDTLRFFHVIEPAEWPNAKAKANAVMQLIPEAECTFVFIEGTAHGDTGWFAETWKSAWKRQQYGEKGEGTEAVFYPWFIYEKYRRPTNAAKRKEIESTLSEEEEKLLRQKFLRRGVGMVSVDYEQLAWRRHAIVELCQNSVELFHQEYPAYPEEAFLSTGMKFFSAKTLAEMREQYATEPLWRGDIIDPEGERKMMRTLEEIES